MGQKLRVACHRQRSLNPREVLSQPANQVLHMLDLEVLLDSLGVDLSLEATSRLFSHWVFPQLVLRYQQAFTVGIAVLTHMLDFILKGLHHHLSEDSVPLKNTHLRPLSKELAGFSVAQSKMSSAHLEVAPVFQVRLVVEPGGSEGAAEKGEAVVPLTLVGLDLAHEDEEDRDVAIYSFFDEKALHAFAELFCLEVVAADGIEVHSQIDHHKFH
jgi:hypothetical protein